MPLVYLIATPFVIYFSVKFGVIAYYNARKYIKDKTDC